MEEASNTLKTLFEAYLKDPSRLPAEHQALVLRADAEGGMPARARVVADYVAGMTDRFAYTEKGKLGELQSENSIVRARFSDGMKSND